MPEDLLSMELQKALTPNPRNNYTVDILGDLGPTIKAPGLTNLLNTITIAAHGGPSSGFSADKSATNSLANTVRKRAKEGQQLSLEDIASNMGTATNEVKKAIILACYAAGYNYDTVKRLFPNLEQLVAPKTDAPTSAMYTPYLVNKESEWNPYSLKEISPLFSITPSSTNTIRQASDWLDPQTAQSISQPLSSERLGLKKEFGEQPSVWSPEDYVSTSARPSSQVQKEIDDLKARMTKRMGAATNSTEIDLISKEWQDELKRVFK